MVGGWDGRGPKLCVPKDQNCLSKSPDFAYLKDRAGSIIWLFGLQPRAPWIQGPPVHVVGCLAQKKRLIKTKWITFGARFRCRAVKSEHLREAAPQLAVRSTSNLRLRVVCFSADDLKLMVD
ncbi:hypothetical protein EVAR_89563_1 [Eumeta japonica]|uniref:Uncharacterized protein n=1 Tax=Eumeta variegata TaxID=151549 RepID=A0A4C1YRV6_EUMVA|nr:hypothetical protein EVAR_89563_1 [Eumeta japonica]